MEIGDTFRFDNTDFVIFEITASHIKSRRDKQTLVVPISHIVEKWGVLTLDQTGLYFDHHADSLIVSRLTTTGCKSNFDEVSWTTTAVDIRQTLRKLENSDLMPVLNDVHKNLTEFADSYLPLKPTLSN